MANNQLKEADCIFSIRAKNRGGQHVGVDTTVIVEHVPTGLKAEAKCRSQYKSKMVALAMIEYGLTFDKEF